MPSFSIRGRTIEYEVLEGRSRRYTHFRFRPDLTLEVVVPRGRKVNVETEIKSRSDWILSESARVASMKTVLGEDHVIFEGRVHNVVFVQSMTEELKRDPYQVTVLASDRRRVRELTRRWFLRESSAYVVRRVAELSPAVGVRASRVDVREIGVWGYCTREGRLTFSWQLAALPERLRDYVVFHELTHLSVFNHSPEFKRRLGRVCPDYRDREAELDAYLPYSRLNPPG